MRSFAPIVIAFAVLAPPVRAADDAAPSTTLPPRADVPLPRLVCFGDDLLNRAEAIVEGAAESVTTLGRGVSVTRIHVDHTLLLPADGIALTDVSVLSSPGDFAEGSRYVVFLKRFRDDGRQVGRFESLGRVAAAERDFADKRRVLVEMLDLKRLPTLPDRERALARILVKNVGDSAIFVKWNALAELKALAPRRPELFGSREKARLVEVYKSDPSASLKREMAPILTALAVEVTGDRGA